MHGPTPPPDPNDFFYQEAFEGAEKLYESYQAKPADEKQKIVENHTLTKQEHQDFLKRADVIKAKNQTDSSQPTKQKVLKELLEKEEKKLEDTYDRAKKEYDTLTTRPEAQHFLDAQFFVEENNCLEEIKRHSKSKVVKTNLVLEDQRTRFELVLVANRIAQLFMGSENAETLNIAELYESETETSPSAYLLESEFIPGLRTLFQTSLVTNEEKKAEEIAEAKEKTTKDETTGTADEEEITKAKKEAKKRIKERIKKRREENFGLRGYFYVKEIDGVEIDRHGRFNGKPIKGLGTMAALLRLTGEEDSHAKNITIIDKGTHYQAFWFDKKYLFSESFFNEENELLKTFSVDELLASKNERGQDSLKAGTTPFRVGFYQRFHTPETRDEIFNFIQTLLYEGPEYSAIQKISKIIHETINPQALARKHSISKTCTLSSGDKKYLKSLLETKESLDTYSKLSSKKRSKITQRNVQLIKRLEELVGVHKEAGTLWTEKTEAEKKAGKLEVKIENLETTPEDKRTVHQKTELKNLKTRLAQEKALSDKNNSEIMGPSIYGKIVEYKEQFEKDYDIYISTGEKDEVTTQLEKYKAESEAISLLSDASALLQAFHTEFKQQETEKKIERPKITDLIEARITKEIESLKAKVKNTSKFPAYTQFVIKHPNPDIVTEMKKQSKGKEVEKQRTSKSLHHRTGNGRNGNGGGRA